MGITARREYAPLGLGAAANGRARDSKSISSTLVGHADPGQARAGTPGTRSAPAIPDSWRGTTVALVRPTMNFVAYAFLLLGASSILVGPAACGGAGASIGDGGGGNGGNGGGGGGGSGGAGASMGTGSVSATSLTYVYNDADASASNVSAAFWVGSPVSDPVCSTVTIGECVVSRCPEEQPGDCASGSSCGPQPASAGVISLTGGSVPVSITPTDATYSSYIGNDSTLWTGGQTLTISAAGATVPAFSVNLAAPSQAIIQSPTPTVSGISATLAVQVANDLPLVWTGNVGTLVIGFNQTPSPEPSSTTSVTCRFPASAGRATVPAGALSTLKPGMGSFSASVVSDRTVNVGGWSIDVVVTGQAIAVDGTDYAGQVSFQ
jgi:hypothetical protein